MSRPWWPLWIRRRYSSPSRRFSFRLEVRARSAGSLLLPRQAECRGKQAPGCSDVTLGVSPDRVPKSGNCKPVLATVAKTDCSVAAPRAIMLHATCHKTPFSRVSPEPSDWLKYLRAWDHRPTVLWIEATQIVHAMTALGELGTGDRQRNKTIRSDGRSVLRCALDHFRQSSLVAAVV